MKNLTVSVVLPNFNGEELLKKNLPYLIDAKSYKDNHIKEIIVVDDGSWDGSVKLLKTQFPEVITIVHKKNRGFSAAVNTGARGSKGDLILLINSDVLPQENFLASVIPHFSDPALFAVSLHEKGYGGAKGGFEDGYISLWPKEEKKESYDTFYVSGGSGVFRRSIWVELGGMDEKLLSPFYWEDIDICFRAAKRGYKLLWEPNGIVVHKHESTISKLSKEYVQRIRERNQLLVIWKNITSARLTRKHILGLIKRTARHPGYLRIILMAMGRFGVAMAKRRREVKETKISDEAIFARFK